MKKCKAIENGYTHLGKYCGFLCYIKYEDDFGVELYGTSWLRRVMIDLFAWIEVNIWSPNEYGFVIEEIEALEDSL